MRKFKNIWSQPIYTDDLKHVLIHGALASVFVGAFIGFLNSLMAQSGFVVFTILIGYVIGYRINKAYYTPHVLYPTLAVVFTILGYYFSKIADIVFRVSNIDVIGYILDPRLYFKFLWPFHIEFFSIQNIISVLVFVLMCVFAYLTARGRPQ